MCYTDSKNPLRLPWQHHAITDADGNITDTFAYDTYGKLICRTGVSEAIFCYNGRDGVVTDENGLVYMRARYYSPDMRRFINADIVAGAISNAVTLNRFAYANGNPVSFVDPLGLRAVAQMLFDRGGGGAKEDHSSSSTSMQLGPTASEAAKMSDTIYGIFDEYLKRGGNLDDYKAESIGDWVFRNDLIYGNKNGLFIGVYEKKNSNGSMEYVVVNKGSSTKSDWINNILQPIGLSRDMHETIKFAKAFVKDHADANITFVGHSKGGGEALANAKATNRDAIVFNSVIPNYNIYGLGSNIYTGNAKSYVVIGEILNSAYFVADAIARSPYYLTDNPFDDLIAFASCFVFGSSPFWEIEPVENPSWSPIEDHGFSDIYAYLEKNS